LVNIVPYRKEKMMNNDLGISAESSDHPAETHSSTTENVHRDNRQRNEVDESIRSFVKSFLQAEPPDDSTVVWQYAVIKAAEAVDRKEYHDAEWLYHEAWRALPEEKRDARMLHLTFDPLIEMYRTQQRDVEACALQQQLSRPASQFLQEWEANHPFFVDSMLSKYLTPQWLTRVPPMSFHELTKFRTPICAHLYVHNMVYERQGAVLASLRELYEEIDAYAWFARRSCHAIKAREHALKAFLVDTEGIKAEWDEKAAEIVRAREAAQKELEEYADMFGLLIHELADIHVLPEILQRDLPDLSQVDRAKLAQYEELYQSLAPKAQEEWERFPIVELLDIAKAYLPGTRDDEASPEAETKN